MSTAFHKRVHSLGSFWQGFADMVCHARARRLMVRQQRLDCTFIEPLTPILLDLPGISDEADPVEHPDCYSRMSRATCAR